MDRSEETERQADVKGRDMSRDGLNDRRRLSLLIAIMTGAAVAAASISLWVLYRTAFEVQ